MISRIPAIKYVKKSDIADAGVKDGAGKHGTTLGKGLREVRVPTFAFAYPDVINIVIGQRLNASLSSRTRPKLRRVKELFM